MEYKENFKLSQNELRLIFDALNLWLDSVTPYDYSWAENPINAYQVDKQKMEELKGKIKGV